jgi:hypothetical protein
MPLSPERRLRILDLPAALTHEMRDRAEGVAETLEKGWPFSQPYPLSGILGKF